MNLFDHQKRIVKDDMQTTGLWLGTGSGKTRIALLLSKVFVNSSVLIIAPKTQVEDRNWEREYEEIVKEKIKEYAKGQNIPIFKPKITVISKEAFRRDSIHLPRFNTVIVDEAHTCLGVTPNVRYVNKCAVPKTSQIFDALDIFINRTKPDRLYLVTATILKSPMTVWGAAKIFGVDWNWYEFRTTFYTRLPMPGREVWVPKSDSATKDRLARAVKELGYVGRLEDFVDVPDQTYKTVYIELNDAQKRRISELSIEYPDPIVRIGKKHQVENGVLAGDEFNNPEEFNSTKVDKILDFAIEFPRMVIFAKYRAQIGQLEKLLKKEGYNVFTLTGDTKDRGAVLKAANEAESGIVIAQAQISAGWEVPKYPVMIFASMTYSFVDYDQALGRIQRIKNIKKNLYIFLITKGGVDEAVYKCIENKKDFVERLYTDN